MPIIQSLKTRQLFYFLAACLLVLGDACKKDNSSSTQDPGTLSFSYSGDISGNFSATGNYPNPPPANGDIYVEWTKAERFERIIDLFNKENWVGIFANFPTSQTMPESNSIHFVLANKGTGTYPLVNAWTNTEVYLKGELFAFIGGNITVTYFKNGRIRGTFEGSAKTGGSPARNIQITNGQFDLNIK